MSEFFIVVNFHNFPQKKDLAAYNLISRSNQSRLTRRGSLAFLDSYFVLSAVDRCVLQRWCGYTRRVGGPGEVEYFISGLTHTQLRCEDDVVHTLITQPELLKLLDYLARAVHPQLTSRFKIVHYKLLSAKHYSA